MLKIKYIIRELNKNGYTVEFRWIVSHVDLDGKEKTDLLAKRGTEKPIEHNYIPLDTFIELFKEILRWHIT